MSTDWPSVAHAEEFVALERDRRGCTQLLSDEERFEELRVRAETAIGAET